jgi:sortase A
LPVDSESEGLSMRRILFWLFLFGACALAAKPAASAAKRAVSALEAQALWQAARASDRPEAAPGEPALWLAIPSIRLGLPALQDVTEENLQRLPCVVAWPERDVALTVILGHRDTHFRPLERLRKGATITVTRRDGSRQAYRVTAIDVLAPDAAQRKIRARMDRDELALMTCHPFRYIGPAPQRIIFWASRR